MVKVNISIYELLAVASETQGSDYVKGDSMLCERRFQDQTRHMIEFLVTGTQTEMGSPGAYCRRFLTEEIYMSLQPASKARKGRNEIPDQLEKKIFPLRERLLFPEQDCPDFPVLFPNFN